METFAILREYMSLIGVLWNCNRSRHFYIILNCVFLALAIIFFLSTFWFFAFAAVTFDEYAASFYFISCSLLMLSWYSNYLWQRSKYVELFTELGIMIEKSESFFHMDFFAQ